MIVHPDGRIEGTPEELKKYQEIKAVENLKQLTPNNPYMLKVKCPREGQVCFCDGACMRMGKTGAETTGFYYTYIPTKGE